MRRKGAKKGCQELSHSGKVPDTLFFLTTFSLYPGYKSSNPVVSDDGRFMAFQMAKVGDSAGVGRSIFLYDFAKAGK